MACKKCGSTNIETIPVDNIHQIKVVCQDCNAFIQWGSKPIDIDGNIDTSLDNQIKCVKRELGKRQGVYPHLIQSKKISPDKAQAELTIMAAVLNTLESLKKSA